MSHTQKAIGILIGVVLLLVLFRIFFYSPISAKLEKLQEEVGNLDREIAEAGRKLEGLPEVDEKIAAARKKLDQIELQYPRSIEVVYQTITIAARETGLKISRRETSEIPDEASALRIYQINIVAYVSYQLLGEFLENIRSSPMLISVTSLIISSDNAVGAASIDAGDLRVDMQLTTYLSR